MARYNLIFSDENYVSLLGIAKDRGLSMGRLLNIIITEYVRDYCKVVPVCVVCQCKADYNVLMSGEWVYFCNEHLDKKTAKAYKKV